MAPIMGDGGGIVISGYAPNVRGGNMICPNCRGKRIYGFRPLIHGIGEVHGINVELPCTICKGTGELPAYIKYDPELGQKIKELRIENQLTLRHFSHITGIDATILSEQEKGFFRIKK